MSVVHVIVHEPAQARAIIAEALAIADGEERDDTQWAHIFDKACELLGQRVTVQAQQVTLPPDFADLARRSAS